MKEHQSFTELLDDATHLLLDQAEPIREMILWVCKLDDEERAALIMAYRLLKDKDEP